ncbi:hypothetical protein MRX96_025477 [Rhipicephalus microplus]
MMIHRRQRRTSTALRRPSVVQTTKPPRVDSEVLERYFSSSPKSEARPCEEYSTDSNTIGEADIEGHRSVEIQHLLSSLQKVALHVLFRCTLVDMDCVKEGKVFEAP